MRSTEDSGYRPSPPGNGPWRTPNGVIVPRYPADPRTLFIDLLPHESRALGREGIHLNSLTYRSPALEPYLKPDTRGVVRIDPRDISSVFLELSEGGHLASALDQPELAAHVALGME